MSAPFRLSKSGYNRGEYLNIYIFWWKVRQVSSGLKYGKNCLLKDGFPEKLDIMIMRASLNWESEMKTSIRNREEVEQTESRRVKREECEIRINE